MKTKTTIKAGDVWDDLASGGPVGGTVPKKSDPVKLLSPVVTTLVQISGAQ